MSFGVGLWRRCVVNYRSWVCCWLAIFVTGPLVGEEIKGLKISGEKFTYDDGKLSFKGIIVKPAGKGPFAGVVVSHGMGGNGERFGSPKAKEFAKWGFVTIAPDYTHSNGQGNREE